MTLILNGTSGITDVNGTAAAPAITGTDTDTGVFFGTNTVSLSTGGTERLQVDSSGNLGLGVTPSAWSGGKALEVGNAGNAFWGRSAAEIHLAQGYYYNGTNFIRTGSNAVTSYQQYTGIHAWFTAASGTAGNAITFTQAMTLDASGNLGVGTTSPSYPLTRNGVTLQAKGSDGAEFVMLSNTDSGYNGFALVRNGSDIGLNNRTNGIMSFSTNNTERARIDSSGNLLVGKTATTFSAAGCYMSPTGKGVFTVDADEVLLINRLTNDGNLIRFYQAGTEEGNISVSGTTVSYNGGHLARYAQTVGAKDESLVKGTVLSNLDEMNVYTDAEGNPVANEQLNKVKVSDVEGDANVAGVFVNWSHDDEHNVDEINMAMTGDMIIRIAQGTTVARGDLLMSAGNGTAKPQGDDIVRAKTIAKVTSNHVTCTYKDGSYCVPCVLMAC